jgi:hypothetical protein
MNSRPGNLKLTPGGGCVMVLRKAKDEIGSSGGLLSGAEFSNTGH